MRNLEALIPLSPNLKRPHQMHPGVRAGEHRGADHNVAAHGGRAGGAGGAGGPAAARAHPRPRLHGGRLAHLQPTFKVTHLYF